MRSIQIESTTLSQGGVLPTLNVGDIMKLAVRENPMDGMGLIFFKGVLVRAQLPKDVSPGQQLVAQITKSDDQIVFKILERMTPQTDVGVVARHPVAENVQQELKVIAKEAGPVFAKMPLPLEISKTLQDAATLETQISKLLSNITQGEALTNPKRLTEELTAAADGTIAKRLRETADTIKAFVKEQTEILPKITPEDLKFGLSRLLTQASHNNEDAVADLEKFVLSLENETQSRKKLTGQDRELLKSTLTVLKRAQDLFSAPENAPLLKKELSSALDVAQKFKGAEKFTGVDEKMLTQLTQLATRLEQLAASQEMLSQLNPILQALGEPALILFPFLFQGLLTHSEVTVQSKSTQKKKNGVGEEGEEGGKRGGESFRRVQVTVPLPTLGRIDVDVAHRADEILVRLTVENADVGAFLAEQLPELGRTLKELGFSKSELVSTVGTLKEHRPKWTSDLHVATSIIA